MTCSNDGRVMKAVRVGSFCLPFSASIRRNCYFDWCAMNDDEIRSELSSEAHLEDKIGHEATNKCQHFRIAADTLTKLGPIFGEGAHEDFRNAVCVNASPTRARRAAYASMRETTSVFLFRSSVLMKPARPYARRLQGRTWNVRAARVRLDGARISERADRPGTVPSPASAASSRTSPTAWATALSVVAVR